VTGDKIKISARNQSQKVNTFDLMKNAISGLKNASAGGHIAASGAVIQKKDLQQFKQNILKYSEIIKNSK